MKYHKVALGGTFDHFHIGHEALITKAFEIGECVVIGVTSDDFARRKFQKKAVVNQNFGSSSVSLVNEQSGDTQPIRHSQSEDSQNFIDSFTERKHHVQQLINQKNWENRVEIIELPDVYGPTITDASFDAIVVSPETEPAGHLINTKRREVGLTPLEIIVVPWIRARDGEPIHSTRIREGRIGRDGTVFSIDQSWGVRRIPESLRQFFKNPIGTFIAGDKTNYQLSITNYQKIRNWQFDNSQLLITVGDRVTQAFLTAGIQPQVAIIDYQVERKKIVSHFTELGFAADSEVNYITNPAGTVSYEAFSKLEKAVESIKYQVLSIKQKKSTLLPTDNLLLTTIFVVDGEDDLLVLPAILAAPLGTVIVYGQPVPQGLGNRVQGIGSGGIVVVEVSEELKRQVVGWLGEFTSFSE